MPIPCKMQNVFCSSIWFWTQWTPRECQPVGRSPGRDQRAVVTTHLELAWRARNIKITLAPQQFQVYGPVHCYRGGAYRIQ